MLAFARVPLHAVAIIRAEVNRALSYVVQSKFVSTGAVGGMGMQDDRKLSAQNDSEFEPEDDESLEELEDSFDDDEEEEEDQHFDFL